MQSYTQSQHCCKAYSENKMAANIVCCYDLAKKEGNHDSVASSHSYKGVGVRGRGYKQNKMTADCHTCSAKLNVAKIKRPFMDELPDQTKMATTEARTQAGRRSPGGMQQLLKASTNIIACQ